VQTYDGRGCVISCFQQFRVSFELAELPDRYGISGDHQHENCQKTRSQTYAYLQIAPTKQVRESEARVSHGSNQCAKVRDEIRLNIYPRISTNVGQQKAPGGDLLAC
jgi:hypothetical protein